MPPMLENDRWPGLIHQLLHGSIAERKRAQAVLWESVREYATKCRLPLGRLAGDIDVRLDVATRVLVKLERNESERLRRWLSQEKKSWWPYVKSALRRMAIDVARESELNLGRRGEKCVWVRHTPMEREAYAAYLERTEGASVRWQIAAAWEDSEEQIAKKLLAHSERKKAKKTRRRAKGTEP